jgi:predicted transcriptional regulator
MKPKTTARVLRAISDDKSMNLFLTISSNKGGIDGNSLKKQTRLTRKQYYSRLSRLKESGIVTKKSGRYTLTTFGRIVYEAQKKVDVALTNFWKLKAIDTMDMSDMSEEDRQKVTDTLLGKYDPITE